MRLRFGCILVLALPFIGQATAAPSWCAISSEGGTNCYFNSAKQCLAANSGTGGFCMPEAAADSRARPSPNNVRRIARSNFEVQALRAFQRMP